MRVLFVAPHPDDEVFGPGGTVPKYSQAGAEVHVLVVTKGDDLFDQDMIKQGREEALSAHQLLGVTKTHFADLPAIKLDTLPQYRINDLLLDYFQEIQPDLLFLPFPGSKSAASTVTRPFRQPTGIHQEFVRLLPQTALLTSRKRLTLSLRLQRHMPLN
jgi:LmbE family N-acetylglucosaminyl deacetylase